VFSFRKELAENIKCVAKQASMQGVDITA